MKLTPNELRIQETFQCNDRDSKKIHRVITDVGNLSGMTWEEVYDFLCFGVEDDLIHLWESYDWIHFQKSILKKLKKTEDAPPERPQPLSKPIPEFLTLED